MVDVGSTGVSVEIPADPTGVPGTIDLSVAPSSKPTTETNVVTMTFTPADVSSSYFPTVVIIRHPVGALEDPGACEAGLVRATPLPECQASSLGLETAACQRTKVDHAGQFIECTCTLGGNNSTTAPSLDVDNATDPLIPNRDSSKTCIFQMQLPAFNKLSFPDLKELSLASCTKYPVTFIFLCSVLVVFLLFLLAAYKVDQADEQQEQSKRRSWDNHVMAEEKMIEHRSSLRYRLKTAFQREHSWLALLKRQHGTSFKSMDRAWEALMRVTLSAFFSAAFYGPTIQVLSARVIVILVSSVTGICSKLVLSYLFSHSGKIGYREEWELANFKAAKAAPAPGTGQTHAPSLRECQQSTQQHVPCCTVYCETGRFPSWVKFVVRSFIIFAVGAMDLYILATGLNFDRSEDFVCNDRSSSVWCLTLLAFLLLDCFVTQPLFILAKVVVKPMLCGCCCRPGQADKQTNLKHLENQTAAGELEMQ